MAKKKTSGNKSQAIRDALSANPDASPKDIAEKLVGAGHKVTPAYVSIVKYNQSKAGGKKGRKVRVKKAGRRAAEGDGFGAALEFIQASGGLAQARSKLDVIEMIQKAF